MPTGSIQTRLPGHSGRGPGPQPRRPVTLCFFRAQGTLQGLIFSRAGGSSGRLGEADLRTARVSGMLPAPGAGAAASGHGRPPALASPGASGRAELACSRAAHSHGPRHSSGCSYDGDAGSRGLDGSLCSPVGDAQPACSGRNVTQATPVLHRCLVAPQETKYKV